MARRSRPDPPAPQVEARLAYVFGEEPARRAADPTADLELSGQLVPATPTSGPTATDLIDVPPLPPARRFRRVHLGVVVALLVVGLVWAGWAVLRARPVALASPTVVVTPVSSGAGPGSSHPGAASGPASSSPTGPPIVVHVLGAVRRPGLVSLPDRSRVEDAIRAAGGLTRRADPAELNRARLVADGEQIVIGTRGSPGGEVRGGGGDPAGTPGGSPGGGAVLDLNLASAAQFDTLPGVGPVTAGKIVAWRTEHQHFNRVEELQEVDGIGPKTYSQLAPLVRV